MAEDIVKQHFLAGSPKNKLIFGVAIPHAALALAILGLVLGYTDDSDKVTVLLEVPSISV